jgi:hypothetical protein
MRRHGKMFENTTAVDNQSEQAEHGTTPSGSDKPVGSRSQRPKKGAARAPTAGTVFAAVVGAVALLGVVRELET